MMDGLLYVVYWTCSLADETLHILSIGQTGKLSRQEADPLALNNLFIFLWLKLALILIYTHIKDIHQNLINFALILGIAFN